MNRICPAEMNSVELLAEYMCITGKPMPCSKRAYEHSNSLRSAAYERAQRVLPDAARANVVERMCTSTEAIAFKQFQLLTRTTLLGGAVRAVRALAGGAAEGAGDPGAGHPHPGSHLRGETCQYATTSPHDTSHICQT